MAKQTKRLPLILVLILIIAVTQVSLAQAEGGLVFKPYWTFTTESPVNHIQTGDIDGDGVKEVVAVTDKSMVYVLENDGTLNWQYEKEGESLNLLVDDLNGDNRAEIFVGGMNYDLLLSNGETPVTTTRLPGIPILATFAVDLDGNGQRKILLGSENGIEYRFNKETNSYRRGYIVSGLLAIDLWAGNIDEEARPEIIPSPGSGRTVYVFEDDGHPVWQNDIGQEVRLVQGGDVDGDGQAEVVVLSQNWELFLLESEGRQVWHHQVIPAAGNAGKPEPGQLAIQDLDGDNQAEILVLSPSPVATVHVFNGGGQEVWQRALETTTRKAKLRISDLNDDGQAEVVVATKDQKKVYLIDAKGCCLAEYYVGRTTGALDYADLNNDGWGEIIVGTETGLKVFGTSEQIGWQELWHKSRMEIVAPPYLSDLDGDGQGEIVVGGQAGNHADSVVYTLTSDGELVSTTELKQIDLAALSAGDVDNDGQRELAVVGDNQLYLLDDNQPRWHIALDGKILSSVAIGNLDAHGRAEIITGGQQDEHGVVVLVDSQGGISWQQEFPAPVTAVATTGQQILAGTETGQVHRLAADGSPVSVVDLGAEVINFEAGLAATAVGRVYQLGDNGPILIRQFETKFKQIQLSKEWAIIRQSRKRIALLAGNNLVWQKTLAREPVAVAIGDLTGDEQVEIAVVTDRGDLYLFGLVLDQPPLLTTPNLVETRTGYIYSINVNNPEEDPVKVGLQIWDPSAGTWLAQQDQILGHGRGRLDWEIIEPFDIWDAGQTGRFRFSYDDGNQRGILNEIPGPFNIPTEPWYVYYGRWLGLAALILLAPTLGLALYRRQQVYRRSPAGHAEALLKELQAKPHIALRRLHQVAHTEPTQLTLLTGLAREASQPHLARLSEGFQLLVTQPNLTMQGLQAVLEAGTQLPPEPEADALRHRYVLLLQALRANTLSRIVALRPDLTGEPENELAVITQPLVNSQRVEALADKVAYLGQALEMLGRLERVTFAALPQPEQNIFRQIATAWLQVTNTTLQDLQGRAELEATLKTRHLLKLEQAILSLEVTNRGRSPASNISVSLAPDQPFAVSNGRTQLELLPAGYSATVELPIACAGSVEQFRAEFLITYDDRERKGKRLNFADMVYLMKPNAEFKPIANPYAPGTPLAPGSPIFFGRDDLFQFINENIAGLTRQNILVLIGQRRMGKTSFLQQLPARLGNDYLPVYIDGQSLGIDPGMANFFCDLSLAIVDAVAEQGIDLDEPEPEEFEARPSTTFARDFLPAVFEAIGQRQLLLLFDEFEELEMRVISGKLEPTIFSFFRHLMQHHQKLGFIFVGTHHLEALSSDYWSIFFNIALYKHVTFLSEEAAQELIIAPVAEYGLIYDDLALDKILRVTAGQPYFLQLTCHALVNRANRERRNYLTIQDVNHVLEEMVELGEAHFAFLWEQSGAKEQLILAALNRLLNQEPTVTATQATELLAERGIEMALPEVTDTLRQLVTRDIVREINGQPPRYEYKIELVRLWVDRYKALGRVVEEVA